MLPKQTRKRFGAFSHGFHSAHSYLRHALGALLDGSSLFGEDSHFD